MTFIITVRAQGECTNNVRQTSKADKQDRYRNLDINIYRHVYAL